MKDCIIADFEWCVTPHPTPGDYFFYFNEILSAGAVRLNDAGRITDRFYRLIRPENADFVHPIVLDALHLEREELASAKDFSSFYAAFLAFIGDTPVYAWGCADQSALNQNLRVKAPHLPRSGDGSIKLLDLQPMLCRGYGRSMPYPGLAALLAEAGLTSDKLRHNSLSDAEDTARIAAALLARDPETVAQLFTPKGRREDRRARTEARAEELRMRTYETPSAALMASRKHRLFCPSCKRALGIGTWLTPDGDTAMALCACERCGKFICETRAVKNEDGRYGASPSLSAFEGEQKDRYIAARREQRNKTEE